jgi:hypothetical protein
MIALGAGKFAILNNRLALLIISNPEALGIQ